MSTHLQHLAHFSLRAQLIIPTQYDHTPRRHIFGPKVEVRPVEGATEGGSDVELAGGKEQHQITKEDQGPVRSDWRGERGHQSLQANAREKR